MPGKHCSIFGCIKKHSKGGDTSFHAFPKDPDIRSQWILATRRQNWNPPKSAWVCSDHFNKNDFVEMFPGQVRKKLKKGAIPSHMKRSHVAQERASKSMCSTYDFISVILLHIQIFPPKETLCLRALKLHTPIKRTFGLSTSISMGRTDTEERKGARAAPGTKEVTHDRKRAHGAAASMFDERARKTSRTRNRRQIEPHCLAKVFS